MSGISTTAALFAGLALLAVFGCGRHADEARPASNVVPKEVPVVEVRMQHWPRTVHVQGSLLADERAVVGSRLAGRVQTVQVDLGSIVQLGDPIVVLDRRDFQLRVKQAEARLKQACSAIGMTPQQDENQLVRENSPPVKLEQAGVVEAQAAMLRADKLLNDGIMSRGEYERLHALLKAARARYDSALNRVSEQISLIGVRRAELDVARQELEDATIVAPFDAIVEQRHVSPGEYVQPGSPVITLVRASRLRFTAGIPENKAHDIRPRQKVELYVAHQAEPILVEITRVSPTVTAASRAVRIEADVPNADFRLQAGLFAKAEIITDPQATALTVPANSVSEFAGVQKVWLVKDGEAAPRSIQTGRKQGDRVEILAGLRAGDVVVSNSTQGYAGPVVAVAEPAGAQLHANTSDGEAEAGLFE